MGAYGDIDAAIAGLGASSKPDVDTLRAAEVIQYGYPVFSYVGSANDCYNYKNDTETILFDADFVIGNTITFTITVDGVVQSPVAVPFNTNQATTAADIKTAIESAITSMTVTITDAPTNRSFQLFKQGSEITATALVTGGGSQAGSTTTASTQQKFMGISMFHQDAKINTVGQYDANDAVNVMISGKIYGVCSGAVSANNAASVVITVGADKGKFAATGTALTRCVFRSNLTASGLAIIEVSKIGG